MTETPNTFPLPSKKPEVLTFLKNRRSNLAKLMTEPGPSGEELATILEVAARVPDHRKLAPWRFVIFQGEARAEFGQHIAAAFMRETPKAPLDRSIFEGQRFLRAPLVVGVISSPVDCPRGTLLWEQQLSAGAACFNLCLAAQSLGYGAQWLTEWYAYNDEINDVLGLTEIENVAGYIYVGTPEMAASERTRPDISHKTTYWSP